MDEDKMRMKADYFKPDYECAGEDCLCCKWFIVKQCTRQLLTEENIKEYE